MNTKRLLLPILLVLVLLAPGISFGQTDAIHSIDIRVELLDNGDALVEEVWDMEIYQGSEVYLVKDNLKENQMAISELRVKEEGGEYFETLASWDIRASREAKAGKAGYNRTKSGVELCFGFGDYGAHRFYISYRVENFLVGYKEGVSGFLIRLINDELSSSVQDFSITIERPGLELNADNSRIWAFGYEGMVDFQEGKILAWPSRSLAKRNYVNIMASFDEGLFNPSFTSSKTFSQVRDGAMKGSSYNDKPRISIYAILYLIFIVLIFALPIVGILVSIFSGRKSSVAGIERASLRELSKRVKKARKDYYRDIPLNSSLAGAYKAQSLVGSSKLERIIDALILSWLRKGYIYLDKEEKSRFFGLSTREVVSLGGFETNHPENPGERKLYDMMAEASGTDLILQEKEFYSWSKGNYQRVVSWEMDYLSQGEKDLSKEGILGPVEKRKALGIFPVKSRKITEKGLEEIGQLFSLENFLKDFTLLAERESLEVEIWEDYLIYGALFGRADQVAKELNKLRPGIFDNSVFGSDYDSIITTLAMSHHMSGAISRGVSAARSASSGGGGSSSLGGGGGFSGGGSGGGVR